MDTFGRSGCWSFLVVGGVANKTSTQWGKSVKDRAVGEKVVGGFKCHRKGGVGWYIGFGW